MNWRARSRAAQTAGVISRKERLTIHNVADGDVVPTDARPVAAKIQAWEKKDAPDAASTDAGDKK